MLEVEVFGDEEGLGAEEVHRLCKRAAASAGVQAGHIAVEFIDARRMTQLNAEHRGRSEPTDVLSFPVDGAQALKGVRPPDGGTTRDSATSPRELGDVLICPEHTADLREAVIHGVLHLVGMDHETDDGEMLTLQRRLLAEGSR